MPDIIKNNVLELPLFQPPTAQQNENTAQDAAFGGDSAESEEEEDGMVIPVCIVLRNCMRLDFQIVPCSFHCNPKRFLWMYVVCGFDWLTMWRCSVTS